MTREEAIAHGKEQLEVFGGKHAEFIKLAIETLEQEPCEDCVSRKQALIGIRNLYPGIPFTRQNVKKWKEENKKYFECENVIRDLPSVAPKTNWIPVSERLPDERDWYLGIFKEPDTGWVNPRPYICDYVGCETEATTKEYWILNGYTDRDEHIDYYFNLECVAWRPLPEPYQEE